jgi:peptidoglycan hydrolase-like protein with peptidoglycan-binding domain
MRSEMSAISICPKFQEGYSLKTFDSFAKLPFLQLANKIAGTAQFLLPNVEGKMRIKFYVLLLAVAFLLGWSSQNAYALGPEETKADHSVVSSSTVKKAQERLKEKGYYQGSDDGVLGPNTREALRRYQEKENLKADGRLTQETAEHLGIKGAGDSTVGEHFEDAGQAVEQHYGAAGKSVGHGTKELGSDMKKGEVAEGGKDFGKGVGGFGKEVAKGTAKGAKKVGEGVKDAFDPNEHKSKAAEEKTESSESVVKAQRVLKDKGYYDASVDGLMGPRTEAALRSFQEKEGLTPTGSLNKETRKKLGID